MTRQEIKKQVKQFKIKFGISKCDYDGLKKATEQQGYTIVEYNQVSNDGSVQVLIDTLSLADYISHSKGFTYADQNYRIVFIHEDLTDEEKVKVLAHENGHIFLQHFSSSQVIGKDVQEEYEANEFAHYIQLNSFADKVRNNIANHKRAYIFTLILLIAIIIIGVFLGMRENEKQYYDDYYITSTGNKYHKEDCIFVKDKTNTERLTKEQFESEEYEPCAMCLPE